METLPAGGSKAGVSTPSRVSLWPVKVVLHQAGRGPLAGHADVLFAVREASETEGLELDCGLEGPDGLDGLDGPDGLEGSEGFEEGGVVLGKRELAEPAVTAEHADIPRHTKVKAANRIKDTQRLIDPPLRTDSKI